MHSAWLAAANNHLTGGLEPLRGCTALLGLLRQRTREDRSHPDGQIHSWETRGCAACLCTPPRAVGHVAARVPPVGWLRGGRIKFDPPLGEQRTAKPKRMWETSAPNPPRKSQKVRVYSNFRVLTITLSRFRDKLIIN